MNKNEAEGVSSPDIKEELEKVEVTSIDEDIQQMDASNEPRFSEDVKAVVDDRGGNSINLNDGSTVAKDIIDANNKAEHNDIPEFLKDETDAKDTGSGERNPDDDPEIDPMVEDQIRQQGGNVNNIHEDGMTDYDIEMANKVMAGEQELRGGDEHGLMGRTGSDDDEVGFDDDIEKAAEIEEKSLVSAKVVTDKLRAAGKTVDTADVTELAGNFVGAALVGAAGVIDAATAAVQGDLNEAKAELAGGAVEAGVVLAPGGEYADAASMVLTGETLSHKLAESAREAVRAKLNPQDEKEVTEIGQDLGDKGVLSRGDVPASSLGELSPSPVGIDIQREEALER